MNDLILRNILKESSMPYLAAPQGFWIDGDRNMWELTKMKKEYLVNCYKTLQRDVKNIGRGFFLGGVDFDMNNYDEIIRKANELCNKKINELAKEILRRK